MKWTEEYITDSHDLDFNSVARTSALMHYVQESANAQHRNVGPTLEQIREDGFAFLVSRFSISVKRPILPYERLSVSTFTTESRGYSFNRIALIHIDGEEVAEAHSVWAMVDLENRRPQRVSDSAWFFEPEAYTLPQSPRIVFPKDGVFDEPVLHRVSYGDCDLNMHMNNTKYVDMLCDLLPMENQFVSAFQIHFLNEAKHGDTLSLLHMQVDGKDVFRTLCSDGKVNVEAAISLSPISSK